ncbi:hypothetical protein XENOCAPTIV_028293, partial [Xenoophorus captivus]
GLKDMEQDSSSMEKRFAYKFLKRVLKNVDSAQEFIAHLAEDLEKLVEMLKLGKFMQSRAQMKSVTQSINYVTVALLPILTALFEHITTHEFDVDLLCKFTSTLPA